MAVKWTIRKMEQKIFSPDPKFITRISNSQVSSGMVSCIEVCDENLTSPAYTTCP
jgi:hypothetical protein